jgi:hypothetical protein
MSASVSVIPLVWSPAVLTSGNLNAVFKTFTVSDYNWSSTWDIGKIARNRKWFEHEEGIAVGSDTHRAGHLPEQEHGHEGQRLLILLLFNTLAHPWRNFNTEVTAVVSLPGIFLLLSKFALSRQFLYEVFFRMSCLDKKLKAWDHMILLDRVGY